MMRNPLASLPFADLLGRYRAFHQDVGLWIGAQLNHHPGCRLVEPSCLSIHHEKQILAPITFLSYC
jgi:hypothetical protein